jgi:hypothetical protein
VAYRHTGGLPLGERPIGSLRIARRSPGGTTATYSGPSLFKRLAARANPTGCHLRRIFLSCCEGRPMGDMDMAILAEVVRRDPTVWGRAKDAWLAETGRPSKIDYEKAWSSEARPAPLSALADEMAEGHARTRRASEWTEAAKVQGHAKLPGASGARRAVVRPRSRGRRFRRVRTRSASRSDPDLADEPEAPGPPPPGGWRASPSEIASARSCEGSSS